MRAMLFVLLVGVTVTAGDASAQTKISGTQQCKAEPPTAVPIPDMPDHAFAVIKAQCSWTTPIEIAGLKSKDGDDTISSEITGDKAVDTGYYVGSMSNGDKIMVRFSGTSHSNAGKPVSGDGTWSFTGGTGKLKALKGKGTYKGTANADGTMTYKIEGDYTLP